MALSLCGGYKTHLQTKKRIDALAREYLQKKAEKMQKKIHLFNCDHLYELRVIEDLLNSSRPMLHDKLGFDFTVEHHYFSLNEINELSEKVIPSLKMDFAVFVVHAQESRVSINDGRGYTKVYRALMKATGKNSKRHQ